MTLAGIDIGTSAVKVVIVGDGGEILASASRPLELSVPGPQMAEQNPDDWVAATRACLDDLASWKPDAVGWTGQMHGSVFLDEHGKVIRPALLWCDQRTEAECAEVHAALGHERYRAITGNPCLPGFQVPKILWLRRQEPESFSRVRQVLLPKDYVRFALSGVSATDVSDASGTGILDLETRDWSAEVLASLNLTPDWFPAVHESDALVGTMREVWPGCPVIAGAGDQAAGAVGVGVVSSGLVSVSLGTSGVVFAAIDRSSRPENPTVHTFCHANRAWHRMGVMLSCGAAVAWASELLAGGDPGQLDQLAQASAPGANGVSFAPYLLGERCPFSDPTATGAWAGLTISTAPADLARAVIEGVTMGLRQCADVAVDLAGAKAVRVTGGGSRSEVWRQILADVFERPVETMATDAGPAYGAALLAGVGIGHWSSVREATAHLKVTGVTEPSGQDYSEVFARYKTLSASLRSWSSPPNG